MTPTTVIQQGDALDLLRDVPSASVDLIKTSPPWPSRHNGPHEDEFVAWFLPFCRQFYRVLRPTGSLVMHIKEPVIDGDRHTCVMSLTLALKTMGYRWHDEYLYTKTKHFPRDTSRRLLDGFDRILQFTVSKQSHFYPDQVAAPRRHHAQGKRRRTSRADWRSPTGSDFLVYRDGWEPKPTIVPTNVLRMASEFRDLQHPTPYPEELPEFFIRLLTKPGDTVLDPFLGSGTTSVVAQRLGRSSLGFERNPAYVEFARRRIAESAATPSATDVPDEDAPTQ